MVNEIERTVSVIFVIISFSLCGKNINVIKNKHILAFVHIYS